jgi:hypothetical protein
MVNNALHTKLISVHHIEGKERSHGADDESGSARGRLVATIIVTQDGVHAEPILDLTKVALAGMTTGTFILVWLLRLVRGSKGEKGPSFSQLKKAIEK